MFKITQEVLDFHKISSEEYQLILKYIGKEPNLNEIGIFSAMWNEHCGYKNTKPLLKKLPTKGKKVVHGPGENAGVIDIGGGDVIAFKMESHNHPSAVEPYQGAATGVGGILRDIFTMGARPIAILDPLYFGDPTLAHTKHLVNGVVRGISGYGNCMGIPTVGGMVFFDETYNQNILVNVMCVGLAKKKKIVTSEASGIGNILVYYGSTTGRDGVHGASFASAKLEADNELKSAIQVGDPFMEKLLLEATLELIEKKLVIAAQDMGAAGLTSSSTEMSAKGGNGVKLVLDNIPKRAADLTPYEMLLSESQERMLALIKPEKWQEVKAILDKWGIYGAIVGEIIPGHTYEVWYHGEKVVDLPLDAIIDKVPSYTREVLNEPAYYKNLKPVELKKVSIEEALKKLISSPNIASKNWIYSQYDYMVGDNTVLRPGNAGAAIVRIPNTKKGVVITTDCNPRFIYLSPQNGTEIAVSESARNIVAVGGEPMAITNCLNFGTPLNSDVYFQIYHALQGMKNACLALNTPVTGGNASLYNEGKYGSIYPTPTIGMVGIVKDVNKMMTPEFKKAGDILYLIGETKSELDGSEYAHVLLKQIGKKCPEINLDQEKKNQALILELIHKKMISSADDLSLGGLAVALAKAAFPCFIGAEIQIQTQLKEEAYLFSESQSRFIVSVDPGQEKKLLKTLNKKACHYTRLGVTVAEPEISFMINETRSKVKLSELKELYLTSFEKAIS